LVLRNKVVQSFCPSGGGRATSAFLIFFFLESPSKKQIPLVVDLGWLHAFYSTSKNLREWDALFP
jgi:hypothetical protein